ncbi:MAG TPA: NYN domain-containing protein [Acidimicrobiales bacterium]|nr:NYN domain-containing protein [Acidimicrobiales bacterium]
MSFSGSTAGTAERWIVDGMNVIGSRPDGWWRDRRGAQRRLVDRLAALPARPGPVVVVFDGDDRPGGRHGDVGAGADGVRVVFAGVGRDAADSVIVRMVQGHPRPSQVVVVTSDRGLAARVVRLGAAHRPASEVQAWEGPAGQRA